MAQSSHLGLGMPHQNDDPQGGYFPPHSALANSIAADANKKTVTIPQALFELLLRSAFLQIGFDPQWYRQTYRDVAEACSNGAVQDELSHFVESGYKEGRLPRIFDVDGRWYRQKYPDIDAAIARGKVATAHHHYNATGYFEGRYPNALAEKSGTAWLTAMATPVARSKPAETPEATDSNSAAPPPTA
jgi:hypothetical protein